MITICGTTYQTAKTLDLSLQSVISALEKLGIKYEVVIVDNYSTDGTYEKLLEWTKKIPMRVYRYRCSRGLGRALCVRLARGDYIFMVDLDRVYDQNALIEIIKCHKIVMKMFNADCAGLCNKDILLKVNFRDLNRAEDVDEAVRQIINKVRYISIPLSKPLYKEVRISRFNNNFISKILRTFISESRYSVSINDFLKRELRNALDMLTGGAYTLTKFIREDYHIWNRDVKTPFKYALILMRAVIILTLLIINRLRGVETYEISKYISNHLYTMIHSQLMTLLSTTLLKDICPSKLINIRDLINDPESIYAWSMIIHEKRRNEGKVHNY